VGSKDAASTYFWIVPDKLGQIPFEVSAVSGYAADAIRRLLLVEVNTPRHLLDDGQSFHPYAEPQSLMFIIDASKD